MFFSNKGSKLVIKKNHINSKIYIVNSFCTILLYPLMGIVADVWTGRYRMLVVCTYLFLVVWTIGILGFIVIYFNYFSYALAIFLLLHTVNGLLGIGIRANILPFNIDQLIGASGEELSAIAHWHPIGHFLAKLVSSITVTIANIYQKSNLTSTFIISFGCSGVFIMISIVSHCYFKRWLDTTFTANNPIKVIFKVVNYARKNKFPRCRSAFTYHENDYPSRLDLGKEKYGGPFSEEQVEDVKTIVRLVILLLICLVGNAFVWDSIQFLHFFSGLKSLESYNFIIQQVSSVNTNYTVALVLILLYQFLLYPCFHKHIPSMLRRIGIGLFFVFITNITYMVIVFIGHQENHSAGCIVLTNFNYTESLLMPINYKWLLLPQILGGIALYLIQVTSLEFAIAQSPGSMRGLLISLWYSFREVGYLLSGHLYLLFTFTQHAFPSCGFYYFFTKSVISILILTLFAFLARRFKLRVRNNVVNIYQITEEHYEKYFDQSEEFWKNVANNFHERS